MTLIFAKNARLPVTCQAMNTRLSLGISLLLGINAPGLWSGSLRAADAPAAPFREVNVARASLGARLTVELPVGTPADGAPRIAQALLSEDDPLGCELPAGATSLVVALPRSENLHRLDFLNLTAAGQVSVAVSNVRLPANSPRWRALGGAQEFATPNDVVACELGAAEARYVRVAFTLPRAGRIDTLGLFGDAATATGLGVTRARPVGGRAFVGFEQIDNGNVAAHARVTQVSSGGSPADGDRMLDGNLRTNFTFSPTDRHPMTVIDLGSNRTLTRVSMAYHAGPGRMDFYLTPDPNAHTSIVQRNPSYSGQTAQIPEVSSDDIPADRTPVGSVQSDGRPGLQRATVSLDGQAGRYLVVAFTPAGRTVPSERRGTRDFKDYKDRVADYKDYKDFKDAPVAGADGGEPGYGEPLSLAELAAFGPPSTSSTVIPQLPPGSTTTIPGVPPAGTTPVITP